jgi:hypothetical protein
MKNKIYFFTSLVLTFILFSCPPDDDGLVPITEVERTIQQIDDDSILNHFLETHYYNSGELSQMSIFTINDIVITALDDDGVLPDPDINTLLIDDVIRGSTVYEDTDYDYYYLSLNQGGGEDSPNFTDKVRVNYEGSLLNGDVFDNTITPVVFDLTEVVAGWSRIIPEFNIAEDFNINSDGTVSYTNPGIGIMFIPSGLAYYSSSPGSIPVYSCLSFKFSCFQMEENDHDSDNIASYQEDLNGNLNLFDDDTDGDNIYNFVDIDDDNDGTLTIDEDLEPDTDFTVDRDGDGDPTNDIGDGDPTNDDSDGDGIPNYLDEDDSGSRND